MWNALHCSTSFLFVALLIEFGSNLRNYVIHATNDPYCVLFMLNFTYYVNVCWCVVSTAATVAIASMNWMRTKRFNELFHWSTAALLPPFISMCCNIKGTWFVSLKYLFCWMQSLNLSIQHLWQRSRVTRIPLCVWYWFCCSFHYASLWWQEGTWKTNERRESNKYFLMYRSVRYVVQFYVSHKSI